MLILAAGNAGAEVTGFTWNGSLELGVDSTVRSDDPTAELTDTYGALDLGFEAVLAPRITAFGALTMESVTDPALSRQFDDMGIYIGELGLRFDLGGADLSVGKISPSFAYAWDETPGFYGTALAEDYELSEAIGAQLDYPVGNSGATLSLAVFFADDTALSRSFGTDRGRNTTAAGGAGNTGKLNNLALQFTQETGDTTWWAGMRHLSAGVGDVSDETGAVAGLKHGFANGVEVITEVAHFDGFGGGGTDATYATLGASYGMGDWAYSASATGIDNAGGSSDNLIALGVDYTFSSGIELGGGVSFTDIGGVKSRNVGMAVVIPLGG
tara:strand:- start:63312 stop:64292 length:981 start_codon:yes stop_codon:yes gene_type:complete